MRVVIDPNVLFSALIAPGGTSDKALRVAVSRTTIVVSPHLLDRFVQRASDDRFRRWFRVADASELANRLSELAVVATEPRRVPSTVHDDPTDDYLVALARHAEAELLLTGDGGIHRALEDAADILVVSPAEFLTALANSAGDS